MCAVVYARDYQGDLGQRLKQAYDALPKEGGEIDARELGGDQVISEPLTLGGNWSKMVTVLLGRVTVRVKGMITLGRGCGIVGVPTGYWGWQEPPPGGPPIGTHLVAEAPVPALVSLGSPDSGPGRNEGFGTAATVRDLTLHGKDAVMFAVIRVVNAVRVDLANVNVAGSPAHGIALENAGGAKLTKVGVNLHKKPKSAGLYLVKSNDVFVSESHFLENYWGIHLVSCGALRLVQCDLSNSIEHAIYGTGTAGGLIAVGNQLAENGGHDIAMDAEPGTWAGNVITGNRFLGSTVRPDNTYSVIRLQNSIASTVTGNYIYVGGNNKVRGLRRAYAGVHLLATAGGRSENAVTGNAIRGTPGAGGPIAATPADVVAGNAVIPG